MYKPSKITDNDWKYPAISPNAEGQLDVSASPPHSLYWAEYGNPAGEPVIFVHGGPGGGTAPDMARFFNPARYRIILFDQRGCGKSIPTAAADDAAPALADNTTQHSIADIIKLRAALGITGKMHILGGSWGSTLALAYAIAHPDTVQTLILRGIFLCRRQDLDFFYQGNADDLSSTAKSGAYMFFPKEWKAYVENVPPADRHDMVAAYARIFAESPATPEIRARQLASAIVWSVWEGVTSYLEAGDTGHFADPAFAKAFARIENHYFMNGAFLGGSGEGNRDNNYIIENVYKIKHIPIYIVHGRYDIPCPLFQAEALVTALRAAGAEQVEYRITPAGHSMMEFENHRALTEFMDGLPR
jgi:proline iminopeptidase